MRGTEKKRVFGVERLQMTGLSTWPEIRSGLVNMARSKGRGFIYP